MLSSCRPASCSSLIPAGGGGGGEDEDPPSSPCPADSPSSSLWSTPDAGPPPIVAILPAGSVSVLTPEAPSSVDCVAAALSCDPSSLILNPIQR